MAAGTYWVDRDPATAWFSTIPFGMDPQGMAAWYYHGDGLKVWEETFAPFNLDPAPRPGIRATDGRMVPEEDQHPGRLQGPQDAHRGPRRAGHRARQAPRQCSLRPPRFIPPSSAGVIDAGEWVGPHDDMKLGLHKTARYYYYPGWHEPGTVSEFGFNKKAYESLPADLRRILDLAAVATQVHGLMDFHAKNAIALERLKTEFKDKVELVQFPAPVLRELKKIATQVIQEYSEKSPMARKVNASFAKFQALVGPLGPRRRGRLPAAPDRVIRSQDPAKGMDRPVSVPREEGDDRGTTPVHRESRRHADGRSSRGRRRCAECHRAAESPVADAHDLAARARHAATAGLSGCRRSSPR